MAEGSPRSPSRGPRPRVALLVALGLAAVVSAWAVVRGPAEAPGEACPPGRAGCPCTDAWECAPPAACAHGYCWGGDVPLPGGYLYSRPASVDYDRLSRLILSRLDLAPGMRVADVGAGGPGTYTFAAAEAVGPTGYVYATDLDPRAVRVLRERAAAPPANGRARAPIEVRAVAAPRDTALDDVAPGSLDRVLMINVFGFTANDLAGDAAFLNRLVFRLKPGGRLFYHQDWLRPAELDRAGAVALFAAAGLPADKVVEVPLPADLPPEADLYERGPREPPTRVKRGYILVFER